MKTKGFEEILGARISGVVLKDNPGPPHQQVFLAFSDGTYFEIYGGEGEPLKGAKGRDEGSLNRIQSVGQKGASVAVLEDTQAAEDHTGGENVPHGEASDAGEAGEHCRCSEHGLSERLLDGEHRGVLHQLNFLIAAMRVQHVAVNEHSRSVLRDMSKRRRKAWLKAQLTSALADLGQRVGFIEKGLAVHVFQLYLPFDEALTAALSNGEDANMATVHDYALQVAAEHLADQFRVSGRADICGFLQLNPTVFVENGIYPNRL